MLGTTEAEAKELMKRVKVISSARRPVPSKFFELIGDALVKRRRVQMKYLSRGRGEMTEREVSPQRLVHHRSTWYLDAWCHKSDGIRRFALDAVNAAAVLESRAKDVSLKIVEGEMDGGYGIYGGGQKNWATLVFEPQAAQWVCCEQWHSDQKTRWLSDSRYEMKIPYSDPTELAMDILRHGEQVSVIEDTGTVSETVASRLKAAVLRFG
jgi:predicted DNA-binding transcriptional regulator YafY